MKMPARGTIRMMMMSGGGGSDDDSADETLGFEEGGGKPSGVIDSRNNVLFDQHLQGKEWGKPACRRRLVRS